MLQMQNLSREMVMVKFCGNPTYFVKKKKKKKMAEVYVCVGVDTQRICLYNFELNNKV